MSDSGDSTEVEAEAPEAPTEAPEAPTEEAEAPTEEAEAPAPLVSPAPKPQKKDAHRSPTKHPESAAHRQRSCKIHWLRSKLN